MNYCPICGKPTENEYLCDDCIAAGGNSNISEYEKDFYATTYNGISVKKAFQVYDDSKWSMLLMIGPICGDVILFIMLFSFLKMFENDNMSIFAVLFIALFIILVSSTGIRCYKRFKLKDSLCKCKPLNGKVMLKTVKVQSHNDELPEKTYYVWILVDFGKGNRILKIEIPNYGLTKVDKRKIRSGDTVQIYYRGGKYVYIKSE